MPQLSGQIFLADAGLETDLIFNHGIDIPEFAAHTLLPDLSTRELMAQYFRPFLRLAQRSEAGFILDSQTWKAHMHWAKDLGATEQELHESNLDSISFIAGLRAEFATQSSPIVLNGIIGPRGDGYAGNTEITAHEAEDYHSQQISWLAQTQVDMVTATTFPQADEAIGLVRAAHKAGLPVVVSFTVETDGCLPTGQPLDEAIQAVDRATSAAAAYFLVNCAHPEHFFHVLEDAPWARRILGLRCNASPKSHAELDQCETLDDGDPAELAGHYQRILPNLPWLRIFGGCCGTDLRHVEEIAKVAVAGISANR